MSTAAKTRIIEEAPSNSEADKENQPTQEEQKLPAGAVRILNARGNRLTHPVTGVVFPPGKVVDIVDLQDPDNIFVVHQLEAGLFEIYAND
jgi:hypothetical protein